MKRRGIVLELEERKAIVLTPDGDFCRIPRAGKMEVGMEVTWRKGFLGVGSGGVSSIGQSTRFVNPKWRSVASGLAAAVVIGAGVWGYTGLMHPQTAEAYAWVSLDVNPSISLKIDKNFRVRKALGTDADGKSLVSAVHLVGLTLSQATADVLSYANSHHYLVPQSGILVAVSPIDKGATGSALSAAAEKAVQSAIKSDQSVQLLHPSVFAVAVPQTIWKAADQAHVSPGRLMSVLVAAMEGQKTGILDIQGSEIVQVWSNPLAKQAALQIQSNTPAKLTQVLESLTGSTNAVATSGNGQGATTAAQNEVSNTAGNANPPGQNVAVSPPGQNVTVSRPGKSVLASHKEPKGPGGLGNVVNSIGNLAGSLEGQSYNSGSEKSRSKQENTASNGKAGGKHSKKGQGSGNWVDGQTPPIGNFAGTIGQNFAAGQGETSNPGQFQSGSDNQRGKRFGLHTNPGHDKQQAQQWTSQNSIIIHLGNQTLTIPLKVGGDTQQPWNSSNTQQPWNSSDTQQPWNSSDTQQPSNTSDTQQSSNNVSNGKDN